MEETRRDQFVRRRLPGAIIAALLIAIVFGGYTVFRTRTQPPPLSVGSTFPTSSLSTLTGQIISTDSLLVRKCLVAVISTSCPLCRKEILTLDSIGRMEGETLDIIVLSLNSRQDTERFRNTLPSALPMYLINNDEARRTYRITSLPLLFFIGDHKEITSIVSSVIGNSDVIPIIQ